MTGSLDVLTALAVEHGLDGETTAVVLAWLAKVPVERRKMEGTRMARTLALYSLANDPDGARGGEDEKTLVKYREAT